MLERATFRNVANLLSDAVVLADQNGRITWTNDAFHRLCGHQRSFVKGRKPGSFLQGPETDETAVDELRKAVAERVPVDVEILNYHQNGRPYWVSISLTPVKNPAGEHEGFIAIEREITPARCREHALQEEVGTLYSALVHTIQSEDA